MKTADDILKLEVCGRSGIARVNIRGDVPEKLEPILTSGRVPTEMSAKAAALGISLIATRTTPTDSAVSLCRDAGIVLVGYVRGGRFTIYTCPDRRRLDASLARI